MSTSVDVGFAVGDRFRFRGLGGQEARQDRFLGSGSVGWLIEVCEVAPWGALVFRCAPEHEDVAAGKPTSVGVADAAEMVRQGIWEPVS